MSKQITTEADLQQELTTDETALITAFENFKISSDDKVIVDSEEVKYERKLDFTDKRVDEDIYIMDFRKVDAQRIIH